MQEQHYQITIKIPIVSSGKQDGSHNVRGCEVYVEGDDRVIVGWIDKHGCLTAYGHEAVEIGLLQALIANCTTANENGLLQNGLEGHVDELNQSIRNLTGCVHDGTAYNKLADNEVQNSPKPQKVSK